MFPSRYKIYTNLQKSILLEINVNFNFEGSKDVMTSAESKVFGLPGPKKRAHQVRFPSGQWRSVRRQVTRLLSTQQAFKTYPILQVALAELAACWKGGLSLHITSLTP